MDRGQGARDVDSRLRPQPDVDEHDVRLAPAGGLERLGAVRDGDDVVTLGANEPRDRRPDVHIVVDDQHAQDRRGYALQLVTESTRCETPTVPRPMLVVSALAAAAAVLAILQPQEGGAAASPRWSGSASCTIAVTGSGYHHSETQRWQLSGPTTVRGAFRFVASHWSDTGSGSSHVTQGDQTRDIAWTVKATAAGQFRFFVRASDKKLVVGQGNAQLRVHNGVTGTQQQTIGGVPQTPGAVALEAFETQLPPVAVPSTRRIVSGSMPATRVFGSFGPFQPGASTVTKSCTWKFTRT